MRTSRDGIKRARRKENWAPQEDKRDDKKNKGREEGTNKAEARGEETQKNDRGWREKEIGGNVRASKTADVRPTFRRQVSRALKNAERERERETDGRTERETEMIKCWLPFVYTCSTRPKHAPVNLIKA